MKRNILLSFLFIFLFSLSFVVSAPPPQTNINVETGLQIFYPAYETVKVDTPFHLHIHITNITDGKEAAAAVDYCYLHLYNSTGSHILEDNLTIDTNGIDWDLNIAAGNFSSLGEHAFRIYCQDSVGGEVGGVFMVTPTGSEPVSSGEAIVILSSLLLLMLISCLVGFVGFRSSNKIVGVSLLSFSALITVFSVGYLLNIIQNSIWAYSGIVNNFSNIYLVLIALMGAGMIALIVYLIIISLNYYWGLRGMKDTISIKGL